MRRSRGLGPEKSTMASVGIHDFGKGLGFSQNPVQDPARLTISEVLIGCLRSNMGRSSLKGIGACHSLRMKAQL